MVVVPGVLLYFNPLPGMSTAQEHLFAFFVATIIAAAITLSLQRRLARSRNPP